MNTATDTAGGPCAVTFAERREIALREFLDGVDRYPADAAWALQRQLERIDRAEAAEEERARLSLEAVMDDDAVARLAHLMRDKLTMTRQHRGGWWSDGCTVESLSRMLRDCVNKGDPVDVANFCAFIAAKGGKIAGGGGLTDIPVKALDGLDAQHKQALSDPNADDDYLRGFNNGIICAHATIFGHEPDYIVPPPLRKEIVEAVTKAECPSTDTRTDYIGRLVPRTATEEGPRNDPADALLYASRGWEQVEAAQPPHLRRVKTTVPVPGADLPAAYVVGAIEFAGELNKARLKFGPMASAHEGYAVIAEEFDELKAIVWQKQSERDYAALRKETVQLGAMVLAFLLEVVNPENRR